MPLFPPKNPRHDPNLHHFVIYRSNALEEYLAHRKNQPTPDVMAEYPYRKITDIVDPKYVHTLELADLKSVKDLSVMWRLLKTFCPGECTAMPCSRELVIQLSACSRAHITAWDHENGAGYTIHLFMHEVVVRKILLSDESQDLHDAVMDAEQEADYVLVRNCSFEAEYQDDKAPVMIQGLMQLAELLDIHVEMKLGQAQVVNINDQVVIVR